MFKTLLLQAGESAFNPQWILYIGIAVVFYFFMIRPQQKKQKDQKNFGEAIKKGDMVVTVGGIHGKVYTSEGTSVVLEVDKGTKMKFEKSSISQESSKQYSQEK